MDMFRDPMYGRRNRNVAIVLGVLVLVPLALWIVLGNATAGFVLAGIAVFFALAFLGRHYFAPGIHWTHLQGGSMPPEYHDELEDLPDRVPPRARKDG